MKDNVSNPANFLRKSGTVAVGVMAVLVLWQILTRSGVAFLARMDPELALRVRADDPAALLNRVSQLSADVSFGADDDTSPDAMTAKTPEDDRTTAFAILPKDLSKGEGGERSSQSQPRRQREDSRDRRSCAPRDACCSPKRARIARPRPAGQSEWSIGCGGHGHVCRCKEVASRPASGLLVDAAQL